VVGKRLSALEGEKRLLASRLASDEQFLTRLKSEREAARRESNEVRVRIASRAHEIEQVASDMEAREASFSDLARIAEESRRHLAAVESQRPSSGNTGRKLVDARRLSAGAVGRHERVLAALEAERQALAVLEQEIRAELGDVPLQAETSPNPRPTEEEVRRLRRAASQYADVDPGVVDEAREMEERQEFLRRHLDDLQAAMGNLREIMDTADHEMRKRFHDAFGAVETEFSRVFASMLPGGEATLTVGEDGGVDIAARLPGKRSRSSASFSGGERSLVASALLFGVLRIRPTPFCVLDEVDAALDEANVDRYLTVLRDISLRTQTIVVTHNRATMEAADILYGLTMDDEGQSGVLALRLDAYDAAV
jgi:chromosome segregation protein